MRIVNWITLYPEWYITERNIVSRDYPEFQVDEKLLKKGILCFYGELVVRPSDGAKRHPVCVVYPNSTPFESPRVFPVQSLPEIDEFGAAKDQPEPEYFDRRHQMVGGSLCLFQRETRGDEGGEWIQASDVLKRAERWFLGYHTGHWPPDSRESELESHFYSMGDVLLSKTFYKPEITGCGKFFMVRDIQRIVDANHPDETPFIVTAMTQRTDGPEFIFDARADLGRIYPWIEKDWWSPEKLIELEGPREEEKPCDLYMEHGYWWSLPKEPRPFRDGAGLLRELAQVAPEGNEWTILSELLGAELTTFSQHIIGLRYPKRGGGLEWLITNMPDQAEPAPAGAKILCLDEEKKRRKFESSPLGCFKVHGARPQEIQLRNTSVVQPDVQKKTVALIGLGALGSRVAELLAQAGIGSFRLCDNECLSTGNVARHVGGIRDFGAQKTRVVTTRLLDINPHVEISAIWLASAVSSLDNLATFVGGADLTISTTADENVESAINQVAILNQAPVLYGRALRRGSMGRVFLVRPGIDPCKACLGNYARMSESDETVPDDWVKVTEREDDVLLHECGRPIIPASAVDLSFVASLVARTALDFIEDKTHANNHWLWSRDAAPDLDKRLARPYCTICGTIPRHEECRVCREPDVISVVLSDDALRKITAEVESSVTTETGGILVGFVDNQRRAVIVRATGAGPNAIKSLTNFERDVEFVQGELEKATTRLGSRGLYVGEWHSHVELDPEPSERDITSMYGIATAPNYATRCPVMLIAGLEPESGVISHLKTWVFPVGGRVYPVEHEVLSNAKLKELKCLN